MLLNTSTSLLQFKKKQGDTEKAVLWKFKDLPTEKLTTPIS